MEEIIMEKLLEQAKELGYALQSDERFMKMKAAQDAADAPVCAKQECLSPPIIPSVSPAESAPTSA